MRMPARTATVRLQFDRRAARFAAHDFIVREVGRRLSERLDYVKLAPKLVLDVGCGLGPMREALQARYPDAKWIGVDHSMQMLRLGVRLEHRGLARITRLWSAQRGGWICADAGALPFADGSADLVVSNLMLHWHPAPHTVMPDWLRVLRTGGLLTFSCFGPDTLKEVRAAFIAAAPNSTPMPFVDMHDFGDMLVAGGFSTPVMDVETVRLTYPNARELLREVAALGGNPRDDRPQTLLSGRQARNVLSALQARRGADGRIALTFEVIYGHAWRLQPRRAAAPEGTAVPLQRLQAELRRWR